MKEKDELTDPIFAVFEISQKFKSGHNWLQDAKAKRDRLQKKFPAKVYNITTINVQELNVLLKKKG